MNEAASLVSTNDDVVIVVVVNGGEYGRILESTSSPSSHSLPKANGNSTDITLRRSSMGRLAIVVATNAMMNVVAMIREDDAIFSARSTGNDDDDNDDDEEGDRVDVILSSETSLRNLICK